MRLAFYRGQSWISRLIKWQTRGRYSHVGVLMPDGSIYESWHVGGVLHNGTIGRVHEPGTKVDIYEFTQGVGQYQLAKVERFLITECGKRYDFLAVARFISRREKQDDNKWFCSELVAAAFASAGVYLLNTAPHKIHPEALSWSPLLRHTETLTTN